MIHEKAGERIDRDLAARGDALLPAGTQMLIYKNNSDRKGNSYGSHENYLMDRRTSFKQIVEHLMPFFVTRQVYAARARSAARTARIRATTSSRSARTSSRPRSRSTRW